VQRSPDASRCCRNVTLTPLPHDVAYASSDAETFAIDCAQSSIRFTVPFFWFTTVAGTFGEITGTIHQMPEPARSAAEVHIASASLRTANALRDRHLRSSHYFDCDRFPSIDFHGTTVCPRDAAMIVLNGALTIRGVTSEIEITLTRVRAKQSDAERSARIRFRGSCVIDRISYGVRGGGILGLADGLIGRLIQCDLDIEAGRVR